MYARQEVYGKCGQSERAWELVQSMPDRFHLQPTVIMYTCLISCQIRHKKHADACAAEGLSLYSLRRTPWRVDVPIAKL